MNRGFFGRYPGYVDQHHFSRYLVVDQGGKGDFSTIREACDFVSQQPRSATSMWYVTVMPGYYYEVPFIIPSYTFLQGMGTTLAWSNPVTIDFSNCGATSGSLITTGGNGVIVKNVNLFFINYATNLLTGDMKLFDCTNPTTTSISATLIDCYAYVYANSDTYRLHLLYAYNKSTVHFLNSFGFVMNANASKYATGGYMGGSGNYASVVLQNSFLGSNQYGLHLATSNAYASVRTSEVDVANGTVGSRYAIKRDAGQCWIYPYCTIGEISSTFTKQGLIYTDGGHISFQAGLATVVPGIDKGAASQTADLRQWLNSAGAVLARVTAAGGAVFNESGASGTDADFRIETDIYDGIFIDASENAVYLMNHASGKISFFAAVPATKTSVADPAAFGNEDNEIGGLTISDPPTQAECQALRDKCEELADDCRELRTTVASLIDALQNYGLI